MDFLNKKNSTFVLKRRKKSERQKGGGLPAAKDQYILQLKNTLGKVKIQGVN